MSKIDKIAQNDAEKWAKAEMFYGEGAGTRRKLLSAEIDQKMISLADTDYADLFNLAYESLNLDKFAKAAIKERQAIDRAAKVSKNFRAIRTGNLQNLSTSVFIVIGVAYVAHQTGYDKKIEAEAKKLYKSAKTEIKFRKGRAMGHNVTKIV